jgi:hypothetical protein
LDCTRDKNIYFALDEFRQERGKRFTLSLGIIKLNMYVLPFNVTEVSQLSQKCFSF